MCIRDSQGREHEVIVLSLVRSNSECRLGHVDDGRRLNVALTRAKRALVVIGDKETLKYGHQSGLSSFMSNVYERCVVIETPPDPRCAADFLSGDPESVEMDPRKARPPATGPSALSSATDLAPPPGLARPPPEAKRSAASTSSSATGLSLIHI